MFQNISKEMPKQMRRNSVKKNIVSTVEIKRMM